MILATATAGCVPDGVPFVEVVSESDPDLTAAELLADEASTSLGSRRLADIVGDVGAVRYDGDAQKRVYLLSGDIWEGAPSGNALHLPRQDSPWPASTEPLTVDISAFDPSQWSSLRAYDVGLCSAFPDDVAPLDALLWENVATGFIGGLDSGFRTSLSAERVSSGSFTPVLRTEGTVDPGSDRFRFEVTYEAPNVGGALGCDDVTLRIRGELGYTRRAAVISYPPQCLHPTDPGHTIRTADGETWDFVGVVHAIDVDASSSGCVVLGEIEDGVADGLRSSLPRAFAQAILDGLLVDPTLFDIPLEEVRPCKCDTECSSLSDDGPLDYGPPGRRHRCKITDPNPLDPCGECWIQLDPDRVHARPEGLEVVIAEDASDPQADFLSSSLVGSLTMCNPRRLSVDAGERPESIELPGRISVPILPPPNDEPSCRR